MPSANSQIGQRTEPTGQLAAEKRVIQRPATQFAQALEAAFHRRLRKCSLRVLRDELVRRRVLRKNGDAWELTPRGKKELADAQRQVDHPPAAIATGPRG
jgi:hypothetical protein